MNVTEEALFNRGFFGFQTSRVIMEKVLMKGQKNPEKSLLVLNDVAGFNVTAYTANLKAQQQDRFMSLPQEEADFVLTSSKGKLRARCSFVDNHLRQIFISDLSGSPSLNQPAADALGSAKGFLERY
jgi:hypothetical protein